MSALKESKLVWEVTDKNGVTKLKFAKLPRSNILALSEKAKAQDNIHKRRPWGFEGTLVLSDLQTAPPPNLTPHDWRWVTITKLASGLNLVSAVSRIEFLPQARRALGLPDDLQTESLTTEQAIRNGTTIEAAYKRLDI